MRRSIAVQGDRMRRSPLMPDRLLEKGLCCRHIAFAAEPEVNSLPCLVHRSVKVGPLSTYLDIGLTDTPREAGRPAETVPALDELWRVPLYPAQDGGMGKLQPALGHHLDQITQAELVTQIPAYAKDDHLAVEMPSCK